MSTLEQLESRVSSVEAKIRGMVSTINQVNATLQSKSNSTDLLRLSQELKELIYATNQAITDIREKLATVVLPVETQYYLNEGDVKSFQANFNKIKAMMIRLEQIYANIVAFEAKRQD